MNVEAPKSVEVEVGSEEYVSRWRYENESKIPNPARDQSPSPGQRLLKTIKSGNMKAVDDLLNDHRKDEHKQISGDHLNAALLEACKVGWKFFVHKLVRSGASVCNEQSKNCTTALHIAAQRGFQDIVNFLLHKGADVNAVDENLNAALILAINPASCTEIINMLLAHGAEVDAQNSDGMTALMKAVEARDIDAIKILILAGADDNKRNRKGQTLTDIATDSGISDVVKFIKYRKKKNTTLCFFKSALNKAVLEKNIEALKIFVDCVHGDIKFMSKCNTDYERANRATLDELVHSMCLAARCQKKPDKLKLEIAKVLLETVSYEGNNSGLNVTSLLQKATQDGLYELVEILCKYEDFERHSGTSDHPALVIAAEKGLIDILKLLLSITPVPTNNHRIEDSALFSALREERINCADILLQKREFSNNYLYEIAKRIITNDLHKALDHLVFRCNDALYEFTQSLLSQAVQHGRVEPVQVLINRGADVNARHDGGKVALVLALEYLEGSQLFEMAKFLVERGAHVNRNLPDKSPLVCALNEDPQIVRYLLEKGADVNEVGDEMGNTPLMVLVEKGFSWNDSDIFDLVKLLLDIGADPNKLNSKGNNAFHLAVAAQKLDVISKLLDVGAELEVRNSDGCTPLLLAAASEKENIIVLLERYGANTAALDNDGNTALSLVLQKSRAPTEKTLRLLAQDKDVINKQGRDGLTPLMLAARNCNIFTIKILLELGANPNIGNKMCEQPCTALGIVLDRIDKPKVLPCANELIKHNGLASMPRRCYSALLKMIARDKRQMVSLMVTRGMAPLYVLAIAQYLVNNWFLTPVDVVGSPLLRVLRCELESSSRAESLSFMDEHLSQPMSLAKLSFVAVSAALGEPAGREERVRSLPLPAILRDKLIFRHEIVSMDMSSELEY
ncbi:ankyrin-3 [Plakobranchus ocellatus]|uniref:Ankyrin-3 n=1 Tax=Plakobranchus ocellatus TaxID=259542 RepID=A0AAV4BF52_9GAST|nr:ankyrin-3 [Plakobranchus ocellatus]